jgi:serine/threonine-protein kinase
VDDDVVVRANARLGALLRGKYRLERVLGVGGMATVYAATHRNGKEFAIKVLHAELSLRSDMRTRFLREGYLANRVNHPGAVIVLDDDVGEDGGAFLVMELLKGESVETLWERLHGKLPMPLVAGIGLQLLDVLAAAHAQLLTHRDIKPANLLVTVDGQIKVLDFGIARLRDAAASRATQTGTVLGTPAFMAPEHAMAKGDEIDAQTDVWAAGATLFTLASGVLVHEAPNAQQILILSATKPARPLASVLPGAPPALSAVIDRALAFEKADRWPSAAAMRDALKAASLEALGAVPTQATISELLDELRAEEATAERPAAPAPIPVLDHSTTTPAPAAPARKVGAATLNGPEVEIGVPSRRSTSNLPRASAPGVGFITDEAVSTEPTILRRLRRPGGVMAAALGVVAVAVGGAIALVRQTGPADNVSTVRSVTQVAAEIAPSAPAASAAPSSGAAAPESVTLTPRVADSAQSPSKLAPNAASALPRSRPAAISSATQPTPTPAATPARAGCTPPYEFDAKGNKRWKRECL